MGSSNGLRPVGNVDTARRFLRDLSLYSNGGCIGASPHTIVARLVGLIVKGRS